MVSFGDRYNLCESTAISDCRRLCVTVQHLAKIGRRAATSVTVALESIFSEFGPPHVLLFDNSPTFLSATVTQLLSRWAVKSLQCCAYRHQGNGIVERAHRTIKRMVERSERCVADMEF